MRRHSKNNSLTVGKFSVINPLRRPLCYCRFVQLQKPTSRKCKYCVIGNGFISDNRTLLYAWFRSTLECSHERRCRIDLLSTPDAPAFLTRQIHLRSGQTAVPKIILDCR